MATLSEYLAKLPVEKLEQALREHIEGIHKLPDETLAMLCNELARRNT